MQWNQKNRRSDFSFIKKETNIKQFHLAAIRSSSHNEKIFETFISQEAPPCRLTITNHELLSIAISVSYNCLSIRPFVTVVASYLRLS